MNGAPHRQYRQSMTDNVRDEPRIVGFFRATTPCPRCNGFDRYESNGNCVSCVRAAGGRRRGASAALKERRALAASIVPHLLGEPDQDTAAVQRAMAIAKQIQETT